MVSVRVLDSFLKNHLDELKDKGLYNEIDPLESPNGPMIKISVSIYHPMTILV